MLVAFCKMMKWITNSRCCGILSQSNKLMILDSLNHLAYSTKAMAHNDSPYLPGGMGILCMNQITCCTLKLGNNPTSLCRWCWTRVYIPGSFYLRLVTMYHLCYSTRPQTTYQQDVHHLTKLSQFEFPHDAILSDLAKEVLKWQDSRDQLVILADCNDDIGSSTIQWWASGLGLVKGITWLHMADASPTFQRGSKPIDGIFCPPPNYWLMHLADTSALVEKYPVIIVWYCWTLIFPMCVPKFKEPLLLTFGMSFKCNDPCIVARHNETLASILNIHAISQWLQALDSTLQGPTDLWCHYCTDLNMIDHLVTDAKIGVENQCRKLKSSTLPWCPWVIMQSIRFSFGKVW